MILTRSTLFLALIAGNCCSRAFEIEDVHIHTKDQVSLNDKLPQHPEYLNAPDAYENGSNGEATTANTEGSTVRYMIDALETMQLHFYELWIGTWPTAIDWTAAVTNTYLSAALKSIVRSTDESKTQHKHDLVINRYFAQTTAFYFGEDAFAIRNEAYDDILWVVLEWLEIIRFTEYRDELKNSWYGTQFIPGFSHRARLFWDLASRGWDTTLCDGGMLWNPNLLPYKNAITNQLFISASVAMYLYSPGDHIDFPFMADGSASSGSMPGIQHDPKYLQAATRGYSWLKDSNMTNSQGLYVDGYHIKGLTQNGSKGSGKCDDRNEMVYTYNQGVILSGLRGLWEATGNSSYLEDGYKLIRNVMASTGWTWSGNVNSPILRSTGWSGLGQDGILEELCDRSGSCSQDSQTFKGIYFQHLTQFCETLPGKAMVPGKTYGANEHLREMHNSVCGVFGTWVLHNAQAALKTRNEAGLFGMWWGQGQTTKDNHVTPPLGASDYRNNLTLLGDSPWSSRGWPQRSRMSERKNLQHPTTAKNSEHVSSKSGRSRANKKIKAEEDDDVNERGRGRTVETQGGGLSVLRSAWELQNLPQF